MKSEIIKQIRALNGNSRYYNGKNLKHYRTPELVRILEELKGNA
jgi:hypothetical protein